MMFAIRFLLFVFVAVALGSLLFGYVTPVSSTVGDWGRTGTLPDGTTVTVRPSKTGPPTIQIFDRNRPNGGRTVQEIRFGS